ncbi:MAG: type II secretion system major pseudopilin GspG [Candidatus Poribacteria bacterium]|nr:type II secretion system major pseudopilin GspG [Candidatus Poribacteria bacterium]
MVRLIEWLRRRVTPSRDAHDAKDEGFTLVEILVVITILGILVAVVSPTVLSRIDQARQTKALVDIRTYADALERYAIDIGDYPTSEEGLLGLATAPDDATGWNGPYLSGVLNQDGTMKADPWGNEYVYTYPGTNEALGYPFDIVSYGKDGQEGGSGKYDADISNYAGIEVIEE